MLTRGFEAGGPSLATLAGHLWLLVNSSSPLVKGKAQPLLMASRDCAQFSIRVSGLSFFAVGCRCGGSFGAKAKRIVAAAGNHRPNHLPACRDTLHGCALGCRWRRQ